MQPLAAPNIAIYRWSWSATSFLSSISVPAADSCFSAGRFFTCDAQEVLIREGAADQTVILLLSGCVKVTSDVDDKGGRALLAIRVGGDVVGELAAVDKQQRSASVQVCGRQQAVICVIEQHDFLQVLSQYQDASLAFNVMIAAKLRASTRRRVDYLQHSPTVRMARVLVELAEDHGRPLSERSVMIMVNLRQVELGTLIGVHEATAQRALRELREAGLVATSHRQPIIHDMDGLRVMAQLVN